MLGDGAHGQATRASVSPKGAVDVVIVNWNSGEWLRRCLQSLETHGRDQIGQVTVVDNGSVDGSDRVSLATLPMEIVRTGCNLGFARACNLGAREGDSEYLLFLNPDAGLNAGTLQAALAFMSGEQATDIGVCGIKLLGEDGAVQRHCARFPSAGSFVAAALGLTALFPHRFVNLHESGFDHLSSRDVDHVIGAFYLIRRELFAKLAGFDERFFVYLEDLDLSYRVRASGYRVHYLADMAGFHKGGGTSERVKAMRLCYSLESRIAYSFKHFALPAACGVALATLAVEPLPRLARSVLRGSLGEVRDTACGFALLWRRTASRLIRNLRRFTRETRKATPQLAGRAPGPRN